MECNKDEALRAIELAEQKIAMQDYMTARKLLLKAQQLYPSFEYTSRILAVVEVHTVAQLKPVGAEIDWYQLLQVESTAADSTIKKNYRKLVLMLHPDKNKSAGAEAAFKLVRDAWAVLSDKTKRSIYDTKRVLTGKENKLSETFRKKEGFGNGASNQAHATSQTSNWPHMNNIETFWTICSHCKMRYEYYRMYLNFNLKCQKCLKIFVANDIHSVPENSMNGYSRQPSSHPNTDAQPAAGVKSHERNDANVGENSSQPRTVPAASKSTSRNASTERKNVSKTNSSTNRKSGTNVSSARPSSHPNTDAQPAAELKSQKRHNANVCENPLRPGTVPAATKHTSPNAATGKKNASKVNNNVNRVNESQAVHEQVKASAGVARQSSNKRNQRDVDNVDKKIREVEELLKEITRKEQMIDGLLLKRNKAEKGSPDDCKDEEPHNLKKLKTATHGVDQGGQGEDGKHKKPSMHGATGNSESYTMAREPANSFDCAEDEDLIPFPRSKKHEKIVLTSSSKSQKVSAACSVAHQNLRRNADFYNFDQDHTEKSFVVGQIWAMYDDINGMPRSYCRIIQVLAKDGFGVHIKWLEARLSSQNKSGKASGLSAACGEFKCSKKTMIAKEINIFSHVMKVDNADKDPVKIYPRMGEVWAVFKDWDKEEFRSSRIDHAKNLKYEIVEVLTGADMGVNAVSLVKLDGYRTVFTRKVKAGIKWFPSTELSRFSHLVPSWKIVGEGAVDGSWDLDPGSLPRDICS